MTAPACPLDPSSSFSTLLVVPEVLFCVFGLAAVCDDKLLCLSSVFISTVMLLLLLMLKVSLSSASAASDAVCGSVDATSTLPLAADDEDGFEGLGVRSFFNFAVNGFGDLPVAVVLFSLIWCVKVSNKAVFDCWFDVFLLGTLVSLCALPVPSVLECDELMPLVDWLRVLGPSPCFIYDIYSSLLFIFWWWRAVLSNE